ncbi:MAG TPA: serine/threonine protein kinase, partial [Microbacterium sp.]|nr:serine/threonine protein kinase [Microbacterium sp.]
AASALRRGDVAAAAAAVPAIATGAAVADDMTQLMGVGGEDTTRIMPTATATTATATEAPAKRKRSPWTWPLIALIVLLLLVLGGTLWALFANQGGGPAPTTSSATPTPTSTTPTPTPTEDRVNVGDLGLIGMTCDQARTVLQENDLVASCVEGNAAESADQEGQIYSVDPTGRVPAGTEITATYYGPPVSIGAPQSAPNVTVAGNPASQVEQGSTVQLNWASFTCPSGTGVLSAYTVTIKGAEFAAGGAERSFEPSVRQADIVVNGAVGSTVSATYTATCGGNESGSSPPMDVAIVAAADSGEGDG